MNRLSIEDRACIISALVEGNSIRSICRMFGVAKRTVTRLLVEVGAACHTYQDRVMRDLPCRLVQCGEIWSYGGVKKSRSRRRRSKRDRAATLGYGSPSTPKANWSHAGWLGSAIRDARPGSSRTLPVASSTAYN